MTRVYAITLFYLLFNCSTGIYLRNETKTISGIENNPAVWTEDGLWGPLLEEWALSGSSKREKRVMKLPTAQNTYVLDETDDSEKESKIAPGKIVNNPNSKPPGRQVSETDLFLLGAIEKLVFRVDFMEKRLRRVEEMMYYAIAGNRVDQEPCPDNFTRVASNCYFLHFAAGREHDWKSASKQCKRIGAVLAEMETIEENQDIVAFIQTNSYLKGKDFWVGGLNPGLLWIWSNSARPVATSGENNSNKQKPVNIPGDGRCLRLAYDPALRSYAYKGTDCSVRHSFICELPEKTSSNELRRLGRNKNILDEL